MVSPQSDLQPACLPNANCPHAHTHRAHGLNQMQTNEISWPWLAFPRSPLTSDELKHFKPYLITWICAENEFNDKVVTVH